MGMTKEEYEAAQAAKLAEQQHDEQENELQEEHARVKAERDRYRQALEEIRPIAAREWAADETNYEWYGDIAGIAEKALGIDIWAPEETPEEAPSE